MQETATNAIFFLRHSKEQYLSSSLDCQGEWLDRKHVTADRSHSLGKIATARHRSGVGLPAAGMRLITSRLYGLAPTDPLAFAAESTRWSQCGMSETSACRSDETLTRRVSIYTEVDFADAALDLHMNGWLAVGIRIVIVLAIALLQTMSVDGTDSAYGADDRTKVSR